MRQAPDVNDPHIADEDKTPEAPKPSPRREVFMKVAENHAAHDHDGGLVIFIALKGQHTDELVDARLVLSAKDDSLLHQYPWKYRAEKASRFFRITIDEVPASALPPTPEERAKAKAAADAATQPMPPAPNVVIRPASVTAEAPQQ